MRMRRVAVGWLMTVKELSRSRFVLTLLLTIPTIFYTLVALTSTERTIAFRLASVSEDTIASVSERSEALVFIGLASVGLLTAFVAMTFVQKGVEANHRLVLCGYRPAELVAAKLAALMCVMFIVGAYACAALPIFFRPTRVLGTLLGFLLGGWVYGCYGLFVGAIVRRELEGILCVVLLANVDVGWLQNPLYYSEAQNRAIIRWLPAYFPSQVSMVSAFSDHSVERALLGGLAYGGTFLVVAMALFWRRMRVRTAGEPSLSSPLGPPFLGAQGSADDTMHRRGS